MKYNSAPLSLVLRIKPRFHAETSFFPETFKIIDFRSLISKIDTIYQNSASVNPYSISKPSFHVQTPFSAKINIIKRTR